MKKIYSTLLLGCMAVLPLTSCMGDADDPNTDGYIITSPTSIGEVNSTIGEVKDKYCANSNDADITFGDANFYSKVKEDVIIEGVVVANDEGGNLYQTLMLRNIKDGKDEAIVLSIKNPFLSPFFAMGQRVKVNLKGVYVGCYGYMPKIGQPYKTSKGNLRLGPMLMELCRTNVELVGKPNPEAPELIPVDLTTSGLKNIGKSYKTVPMLATVNGTMDDVQGIKKDIPAVGEKTGRQEPLPKIFAPEALYDDGYAVNRDMTLDAGGPKVILRTSTKNPIAFLPVPEDSRSYTGIMSYYSKDWQFQLRSVKDINPEITYSTTNNK